MIPIESQANIRSLPVLPGGTRLGKARIAVTDREKALAIWQDVVGLDLMAEDADALHLGAGGVELITLELGARQRALPKSLGLYHVAIHVPTRAALAQMAVRALQHRVRISPTDHLLTEAIYLWDHDGNGIEITFETPWRGVMGGPEDKFYIRTMNGSPHSGREAIDLDDLLGELGDTPVLEPRLLPGTRIGHVHVHVSDLDEAMHFYRDGLGFGGLFIIRNFGMGDVGLNYMPHIVAFNIWSGPNALQPPKGTAGLRHFEVIVPDAPTLEGVRVRLDGIGLIYSEIAGGIEAIDPAGNKVRVLVA
jgi:catechol 2,3-dioxygenase